MEHDDTIDERRLSRRTMIKGTVGATAAMWAAPAVTTLGSRAAAVSLVPQCPQPAEDWTCGETIVNCGSSGPLALCVCDTDVHGNSFCWEDFFCGAVQACTSNADCPSGYACVTTCCGQTCAPACGTGLTTTTTTGQTAAGV